MRVPSFSSLRSAGLAALVAAAVLVPLYGDTQRAPVTHSEWARMLVRALELDEALPPRAQVSLVFSLLSWKSSLSFAAEQYAQAEGIRIVEQQRGRKAVVAEEPSASVSYRLAVLRSGDYRLRLRIAGDPTLRIGTELVEPAATAPTHRFPDVAPGTLPTWIDVGSTHLDHGIYLAALTLPQGTRVERLEVAPPCLNPVEPIGGWQTLNLVSPGDLAVTALQALDIERELSPADTPMVIPGSELVVTGGAAVLAAKIEALGPEALSLRASGIGLRAVVIVDFKQDGLYTLETFGGEGQGQRWLADACHKAVICPRLDERTMPDWRHVLTTRFTAGRHMLAVSLAPGAVVQRIRLVRLKDAPQDYVATLKRVGFDAGEENPVPRKTVIDAMGFIEGERRRLLGLDRVCGDTIDVEVPVNIVEAGVPGGPVVPPVGPPPGQPPPPPPPPVPPTPPPASPTTP